MPDRLSVTAPASSANLGPGFDCLAVALELRNEVVVSVAGGDAVDVRVEGEGADGVATDGANLFVRAFAAAGADPAGLSFAMRNRIPLARGLGSSAATIAAGVAAGQAWAGRDADPLPDAAALEGHPDNVAAALLGGVTVAWTAADGARALRLRSCPVDFVCVIAADELETTRARAALPAQVDHADAVHTAGRAALLVAALDGGRVDAIAAALDDRLHEPFRAPLVPLLAAVRGRLAGLPAYGATLSGAGPSVLVWCEPGGGEAVAAGLAGLGAEAVPLAVADRGVTVS
ncbi:MAG TPA: homoserine kinase [Gaiellales bacterium]|nr:homoserine kinase [Gaiellales bacterium]